MKEPRCRGDAAGDTTTLSCDGKDVGQTFERGVDFIAHRRAPEAEPDSPHSHVGRDSHRLQNGRQLDAAGVTRGSRGGRHPTQPCQDLGADAADEGYVQRVRQPVRGMTVEEDAVAELLLQALPEAVAQSAHATHRRKIPRKLAGRAEGDRQQGTLRARASAAFVAGTMDQRFDRRAAAHKQRADAFWRVNLVAGDRHKIDAEPVDISCDLPDGLRSVSVEQDLVLAGNAGAVLDRLDGSNLVVGMHDADKDRARCDRLADIVGINAACAINGQIRHACAEAFEKTARLDDGRMLDTGGDDVIAVITKREECALEGKIIRLAAAARKNDLIVVTAKRCRHLAARCLKRSFCRCGRPMPAGWIAVVTRKKRADCGHDRRIDGRARVVIEIDGLHDERTIPWPRSPWLWTRWPALPPAGRSRSIAPSHGATR